MIRLTVLMGVFVLGISSLCFFGRPTSALAKEVISKTWRSDVSVLKPDDIPVPIPFSLRAPFPWETLPGIWIAEKGDFRSYFSFLLMTDSTTGQRRFFVSQIDVTTCNAVAWGIGTVSSNSLNVRMLQIGSRGEFLIQLDGFPQSILPRQIALHPVDGIEVLMSILRRSPKSGPFHMGLRKVTKGPVLKCNAQSDYGLEED